MITSKITSSAAGHVDNNRFVLRVRLYGENEHGKFEITGQHHLENPDQNAMKFLEHYPRFNYGFVEMIMNGTIIWSRRIDCDSGVIPKMNWVDRLFKRLGEAL